MRGRYETPVRTVDIAPTLAGLLGIAAPEDLDGVDLGARLRSSD
jgi:arylsulfatase A-like enzyme